MKFSDYLQAPAPSSGQQVQAGNADAARVQLRDALYEEVPSEKIAQLLASGRDRARIELTAAIEQILKARDFPTLAPGDMDAIVAETLDMVLGLGPLERLLSDPTVTEIMVNGPGSVFFEREGMLCQSRESFESEEQLRLVVDRIVSPLGRRVDEQSPIVNARLPEGHRVNAIIPPLSLGGTTLTIRKFRARAYTLAELVELGSLSEEMETLLVWGVQSRKNIAVSGGTGGGKTTLLNALSQHIPKQERIITIEDSAELRFDEHPHVVRLEARMPNSEGKGLVTIRELVINSLRMRPDRIVVGEVRGAEAADMLQAMTTGHDGSLTTLHANGPEEVVPRLVMMVRYGMELPVEIIETQIASALDLVVQQDRVGGGKRRITQIAMRHVGSRAGGSAGFFTPIVQWDRRAGSYSWGALPDWVDDLPYLGIASAEEVEAWRHSVQRCS